MATTYPFDQSEVETTETYPSWMPGSTGTKKFNTPISPKENMTLVYQRKLPVWMPAGFETQMLSLRVDPDNVCRCLVMDADMLKPEEMTGGPDRHGIEWVFVPQVGGSMVKPGDPVLKDANDWEKVIQMPDVDSWPWELSAESNKDYVDHDRFVSINLMSTFFERLISMMDFSEAAVALIDEDQKSALHALFDALADVYIKMVDNYYKYFKPDLICMHDDWGSQRSPFFSLDTAMEMLVPHQKKVIDHVHELGMFYDQHSCGKNEKLVPAYIAAGADSWSGQPMNDKAWIYDNYGDKLILGMETGLVADPNTYQYLTTPEEAKKLGEEFVAKYGPNYAQKAITCFGGTPEFSEAVYVESRKLFASL